MDLKKRLILLSDKLDRAGLTAEANIIDMTVKVAMNSGLATVLEETFIDDNDHQIEETENGS
jgi:hypothetical protein